MAPIFPGALHCHPPTTGTDYSSLLKSLGEKQASTNMSIRIAVSRTTFLYLLCLDQGARMSWPFGNLMCPHLGPKKASVFVEAPLTYMKGWPVSMDPVLLQTALLSLPFPSSVRSSDGPEDEMGPRKVLAAECLCCYLFLSLGSL